MRYFINLIVLWALAVTGCGGHLLPEKPAAPPPIVETEHFFIATAGARDTLASLARTYLGNADKAWQIAAYNRLKVLTPGQRVVIPKVPLIYGGVTQTGYQTVPVLLYPQITDKPSTSKAVDRNQFDRHLAYLEEKGFTTISLEQLYAFLRLKGQIHPKSVVISFDTAQSWVYEIAFPLLKKRHMKAALFIHPKEIGSKGRLSWTQLAEMADNGFSVGLHGRPVQQPGDKELKQFFERFEKAFTHPKSAFNTHIKRPCRYFAYPQGKSDDLTIAMLKKHGYRMAFTQKRGRNPFFINSYKLKRSLIHGQFDMAQFNRNLATFTPAELK